MKVNHGLLQLIMLGGVCIVGIIGSVITYEEPSWLFVFYTFIMLGSIVIILHLVGALNTQQNFSSVKENEK